MTRRQASAGWSAVVAVGPPMPALFTATGRGAISCAAATISATRAASVTSTVKGRAVPPAP